MKNIPWMNEDYDVNKYDPDYVAAGLMIEINEILYTRMVEKKLSQRKLAKMMGVSQPYISKILNDGSNMTLRTLAAFAQALELDVKTPVLTPLENMTKESIVDNVAYFESYKNRRESKKKTDESEYRFPSVNTCTGKETPAIG